MSNWFDDHVVILGVGNVDTEKIKEVIKSRVEGEVAE